MRVALAAVAWLFGIGLQFRQPVLWPASANLALLVVAVTLLLLGWRSSRWTLGVHRRHALQALGLTGLALLGFSLTVLCAAERIGDGLPAHLEGLELLVTGVVCSLPQTGLQGTRFVFDVERAELAGQVVQVPARVALGCYRGLDGDALIVSPAQEIRAGQRWLLTVRLQRPRGTLNPHGFDLQLWLFEQGIGASGSVRATAGALIRKLTDGGDYPVQRARQNIRDSIWLRVPDASAAGVLAALAVGDQAAIDREDWQLFRRTGVAHLISISGLHVTMFAWPAGSLIGAPWRRSAGLTLRCAAPVAARWGGVLGASGYALLAGWGVPAQRTLCMLATLAVLRSLGVRWPMPLVLMAPAVVVTVIDPWALLQAGFWLSFAAVALLLGAQPVSAVSAEAVAPGWWARFRRGVHSAVRTQAVAGVGLAPLGMVFFQQISVVGFLANLVAIPLVSLVITALAVAGIVWPWLWLPASHLVQGMTLALGWAGMWPWATWTAVAAPWWPVACGLLGGALLVMPPPRHMRLLGLPLLLPLLLPPTDRPAPGELEVVVADIGQGTAVLLRTRQHLLVYDTGARWHGQRRRATGLLPLLRARGEAKVDLLVPSHRDIGHVGGAESLLAHSDVQSIASALPAAHALLAQGRPQHRCLEGQGWSWDGVRFDMLHPQAEDYVLPRKSNAMSCVLRVQSRSGRSLLLTGDIETAQEAALVMRMGAALHSDVLVVPHHGSRTSSTSDFLQAVRPYTALVQAACRSRFGHPAADVVARYRAMGIDMQRSAACGAWTWCCADSSDAARCEAMPPPVTGIIGSTSSPDQCPDPAMARTLHRMPDP